MRGNRVTFLKVDKTAQESFLTATNQNVFLTLVNACLDTISMLVDKK